MADPTIAELATQLTNTQTALNIVWTMVAGFLVMFMQAGFALVETGLTRAKNAAHTMGMNFLVYAIGIIGFYFVGFGLQMGGVGSAFGAPARSDRPASGQPNRPAPNERLESPGSKPNSPSQAPKPGERNNPPASETNPSRPPQAREPQTPEERKQEQERRKKEQQQKRQQQKEQQQKEQQQKPPEQ